MNLIFCRGVSIVDKFGIKLIPMTHAPYYLLHPSLNISFLLGDFLV